MLHIYLSSIYLSVCLSVCLSIYLSIYLPTTYPIFLSFSTGDHVLMTVESVGRGQICMRIGEYIHQLWMRPSLWLLKFKNCSIPHFLTPHFWPSHSPTQNPSMASNCPESNTKPLALYSKIQTPDLIPLWAQAPVRFPLTTTVPAFPYLLASEPLLPRWPLCTQPPPSLHRIIIFL